MKKTIALLLFLTVSLCSPAYAEVTIKTSLSDDSIALGGAVRLQIQVQGVGQKATLKLPKTSKLALTQMGRPSYTSSTVINNGKVQKWEGLIFSVSIVGYEVGKFQVPTIEIHHNNKIYTTKPFTIEVFAIPDSAKAKLKLQVQLKTQSMYLGQRNSATLSWLVAQDIANYEMDFPLLNSELFNSTLSDIGQADVALVLNGHKIPFRQEQVTEDNNQWTRYQTKFHFQANKTGRFKLHPARVQAKIVDGYQIGRDFFGRQVRQPKFITESAISRPVSITVLPLPLPKPAKFSEAVGRFQITATLAESKIKQGDPITLTIAVSGDGDLSGVAAKHILLPADLYKYFELAQEMEAGKLEQESIQFKLVIRPLEVGKLIIPPLSFSYFNPYSKKYEIAKSLPIPVQVKAAERLRAADLLKGITTEGQTKPTQATNSRVTGSLYLTADDFLQDNAPAGWFYLLCLSPLLLLGQSGWKLFQSKQPALQAKKAWKQQRLQLQQDVAALAKITESEAFLQQALALIESGSSHPSMEATQQEASLSLSQKLEGLRYSRAELSETEKQGLQQEISDFLQPIFTPKAA